MATELFPLLFRAFSLQLSLSLLLLILACLVGNLLLLLLRHFDLYPCLRFRCPKASDKQEQEGEEEEQQKLFFLSDSLAPNASLTATTLTSSAHGLENEKTVKRKLQTSSQNPCSAPVESSGGIGYGSGGVRRRRSRLRSKSSKRGDDNEVSLHLSRASSRQEEEKGNPVEALAKTSRNDSVSADVSLEASRIDSNLTEDMEAGSAEKAVLLRNPTEDDLETKMMILEDAFHPNFARDIGLASTLLHENSIEADGGVKGLTETELQKLADSGKNNTGGAKQEEEEEACLQRKCVFFPDFSQEIDLESPISHEKSIKMRIGTENLTEMEQQNLVNSGKGKMGDEKQEDEDVYLQETERKHVFWPNFARETDWESRLLREKSIERSIGVKGLTETQLQKLVDSEKNRKGGDKQEEEEDAYLQEIERKYGVDGLRVAFKVEHNALFGLYEELDEERNAAAEAANETMAMISRLQEEKAALKMATSHYQRMADEKAMYNQEAMAILEDMLFRSEKEKEALRKQLEFHFGYSKMPNKPFLQEEGEEEGIQEEDREEDKEEEGMQGWGSETGPPQSSLLQSSKRLKSFTSLNSQRFSRVNSAPLTEIAWKKQGFNNGTEEWNSEKLKYSSFKELGPSYSGYKDSSMLSRSYSSLSGKGKKYGEHREIRHIVTPDLSKS